MAVDKVSGVITPPAGFTMIQDHITGIGVSGGIAYRVAAGGEQSITFSYATASQPGYSMAAFEVSGTDTTSPLDVSLKDITFAGATSRTLTLGPTGTLAIPSSFAFAVFENDSTTSFNAPSLAFAFTNGFTIAATNQSANLGLPGLIVGTKQVSGTDPVSTTASYEGDAADEAIGFLAVFKAKPL